MPCLDFSSVLWDRFSQEMKRLGPFEDNPSLAVAVSGGSDSLALCFLLHKWVTQEGGTLQAFHVDHQLRPESTPEAYQVKAWLEQHHIPCTILTWQTQKQLKTGLQEKARKARYALLDQACAQSHILHLVTAHHADDQQETYRIRQQAHSTDYGLAGMSAVTYFPHCRLIRPLLSFTKEELRTLLGNHPYIKDPSNHNPVFQRAKLRQSSLEKIDLVPYQEKRRAEEKAAAHFLAMHAEIAPEGYGQMSLEALQKADQTTLQRALSFIIRCIGNLDYLPSPTSVEKLLQKWRSQNFSPTSLGKCVLYVQHKNIWIVPDRRSLTKISSIPPQTKFWDRFLLEGSLPPDTYIAPVGSQGWSQIQPYVQTDLPYHVVITLPAYWKSKKIVAVPFLGVPSLSSSYPSFLYQPKNSLLAEFFV